jgi:molybdopterin-guanine dinucleotide biosynthesis protein A
MANKAPIKELCGVILAGGMSRRMGCNKALINIGGRPLIQLLAEQVCALTDQVYISTNELEAYKFLGLPVVADIFPGQGPLAGLHAAMRKSSRPLFLLLACDLPNIRAQFLAQLHASLGDCDAVVPRTGDGRLHPLSALYRRACMDRLESNLSQGTNKVTDLFLDTSLKVRWLSPVDGCYAPDDLCNINNPSDLESYFDGAK